MSGPVTSADAAGVVLDGDETRPHAATIEITPSREAQVGSLTVRRALPRRARRTVGAWCFLDHMGPAAVTEEGGVDIGPHPHIGLQTATWLLAGVHRRRPWDAAIFAVSPLLALTAWRLRQSRLSASIAILAACLWMALTVGWWAIHFNPFPWMATLRNMLLLLPSILVPCLIFWRLLARRAA